LLWNDHENDRLVRPIPSLRGDHSELLEAAWQELAGKDLGLLVQAGELCHADNWPEVASSKTDR
jgi:hypothetical protein